VFNWRDLEAFGDDMVCGVFAERLQLLPYASTPNGRPSADPDRDLVEITGVLYWPDEMAVAAPDANFRTKTAIPSARIAISGSQYPDLDIRPGDFIKALDRPGEPTLKVGLVTADQRSLIVLEVSQ
jgi:hypothetical protein